MKTFLEFVAQDIIRKYGTDLSRVAIVFPNKRASLFLNEHLARLAGKPIWSPAYITISDLFRRHSQLQVGDPIKLTCDLYKVYTQHTSSSETLDRFYGWGQLLISDFDDIDKNMADAQKVFANVKDIHELDDVSYLSDEQRALLKRFFGNFGDDHNTELKKRFLSLWSHLYDIYADFNKLLLSQGLAYEGALYRQVTDDASITFAFDTYLFVGFNMMQVVEQKLCQRLKQEGKAYFYWDFDQYYMGQHEAGHYIKQYLAHFPNELDSRDEAIYANMVKPKEITYINATTENIQARYVSTWLKEGERYKDGKRTAIVLADEKLLNTVIHSLPTEVEKVNITTGYPLGNTPFYSLLRLLVSLQVHGHVRDTDKYRLRDVNRVLRHPYAKYISPRYEDIVNELQAHKRFYPTRQSMSMDEDSALLFADLEQDTPDQFTFNKKLLDYLLGILQAIATHSHDVHDPLYQESLFRSYTVVNRLRDLMASGDLTVDTITLERLLVQLMQSTTIPFHGEPAEGIQVMGILETRNLDFDHVLVLSCNEGNMPKGVNDSSFIPYAIRKAYGLTTIDHKVAIFSYYFHSLIQRASDITLTYNVSTEDGNKGQMSQFMLQLMVECPHRIQQCTLTAGMLPIMAQPKQIDKDEETMDVLHKMPYLSPSAINKYLRCPLTYYYHYVKGLLEPEEEEDDEIDNRIFGNIFHRAAQNLYLRFASKEEVEVDRRGELRLKSPLHIRKPQLQELLKHKEIFEQTVDEAFKKELFHIQNEGYKPEYNGLQLINREVILQYLRRLIELDAAMAPFTIIGLEMPVNEEITFSTSMGEKRMTIGGNIDRLDCVDSPDGKRIRVIDYKTGRPDESPLHTIDEVFTREEIPGKHPSYYLQTMLYGMIVSRDRRANPQGHPVSPALLYIQQTAKDDYNPVLKMGKEPIADVETYRDAYMEQLRSLVAEIFDKGHPFEPTSERHRCYNCPYAGLCGV